MYTNLSKRKRLGIAAFTAFTAVALLAGCSEDTADNPDNSAAPGGGGDNAAAGDTVVIAALGILSVTALQRSNEHIATSELKRQDLVQQWQTDIQMNWLRTEALLKSNEAAYASKLKKDMSAVVEVQSKRMEEVRGYLLPGREKELYDRAIAARDAYRVKRTELVKAKSAETDAAVRAALDKTMERMGALVERAKTKEAYDQMIGQGNDEGNAVVQGAIDALVAQAKELERAIAALDLKGIKFEGSDSLDDPSKVGAK